MRLYKLSLKQPEIEEMQKFCKTPKLWFPWRHIIRHYPKHERNKKPQIRAKISARQRKAKIHVNYLQTWHIKFLLLTFSFCQINEKSFEYFFFCIRITILWSDFLNVWKKKHIKKFATKKISYNKIILSPFISFHFIWFCSCCSCFC
jgi:hypothetical protein